MQQQFFSVDKNSSSSLSLDNDCLVASAVNEHVTKIVGGQYVCGVSFVSVFCVFYVTLFYFVILESVNPVAKNIDGFFSR